MKARTSGVQSKARGGQPPSERPFDAEAFLASAGPSGSVVSYRRGAVVFAQGDAAHDIRYIQRGAVKVSVIARVGTEAVIALLGPGDFSVKARWPVNPFASKR